MMCDSVVCACDCVCVCVCVCVCARMLNILVLLEFTN